MARNVSNNNVDEIKASGVKLEKKEGAWTTCGGVNDALLLSLLLFKEKLARSRT